MTITAQQPDQLDPTIWTACDDGTRALCRVEPVDPQDPIEAFTTEVAVLAEAATHPGTYLVRTDQGVLFATIGDTLTFPAPCTQTVVAELAAPLTIGRRDWTSTIPAGAIVQIGVYARSLTAGVTPLDGHGRPLQLQTGTAALDAIHRSAGRTWRILRVLRTVADANQWAVHQTVAAPGIPGGHDDIRVPAGSTCPGSDRLGLVWGSHLDSDGRRRGGTVECTTCSHRAALADTDPSTGGLAVAPQHGVEIL